MSFRNGGKYDAKKHAVSGVIDRYGMMTDAGNIIWYLILSANADSSECQKLSKYRSLTAA